MQVRRSNRSARHRQHRVYFARGSVWPTPSSHAALQPLSTEFPGTLSHSCSLESLAETSSPFESLRVAERNLHECDKNPTDTERRERERGWKRDREERRKKEPFPFLHLLLLLRRWNFGISSNFHFPFGGAAAPIMGAGAAMSDSLPGGWTDGRNENPLKNVVGRRQT